MSDRPTDSSERKPLPRVVLSLAELLTVTWVSGLLTVIMVVSGVGGVVWALTMALVAVSAWLLAPRPSPSSSEPTP